MVFGEICTGLDRVHGLNGAGEDAPMIVSELEIGRGKLEKDWFSEHSVKQEISYFSCHAVLAPLQVVFADRNAGLIILIANH
jgi:hypothetical protein